MEKQTHIGIIPIERYKHVLRNNLMDAQRNTVFNSGLGSETGLSQTITTLTDIISGVIPTKFYELNGQKLSDFCKIEAGKGAYDERLLQYAINFVGNNGEQGIINPTANGISREANSSIEIGSLTIKNNFWRWSYTVTNELLRMGERNAETFSIIEANEQARKTVFALMLQKAWFLGLQDGTPGLLNQPNVTINTTLMTAELGSMTDAQFEAFIGNLAGVYQANANYTMNFNRLLIPSAQYFALTRPYGQYGLNRLQVLEDGIRRIAGNDFKIVHSKYNTGASAQGSGKGRYVFYNDDADNLCAYMPVPYTPMPLYPQGALDLVSVAHAQFIPPYLKRTQSMLYADVQ